MQHKGDDLGIPHNQLPQKNCVYIKFISMCIYLFICIYIYTYIYIYVYVHAKIYTNIIETFLEHLFQVDLEGVGDLSCNFDGKIEQNNKNIAEYL